MKLSRRLIPAFAMLLVSAVLMSTASFAWFSMNSEVTATDINVTAKAPASLLISSDNTEGSYGSTITLTPVGGTLNIVPVAYNEDDTKFYKLQDTALSKVNEQGKLPGVDTFNESYFEVATEDVHYYSSDLYLKLDGVTGTRNVSVTATFDSQSEEAITNAFVVMLVVGNAQYELTIGEETAVDFLTLMGGAAATKVTVYVYLNGEHDMCKNSSITSDTSMNVDLEFSIPTEPTE